MNTGTVYVEGARDLRRTLTRAGVDIRSELKTMHREVGGIVLGIARQLVPVAPARMRSAKPGLLRDSLRVGGTQTTAVVRAGGKRVPYANPIHWGWHKRRIRPSLFLSRAAKQGEPDWVAAYFKKFEEIIHTIEGA